MTNEQRIAASLQRNPSASNHTIAKNLARHGIKSADVEAVRAASIPAAHGNGKIKSGRTLDAFRAVHDVAHIIETNVEAHLKDSAQEYFTDHEFREICGVPSGSWRRYADDTKFAEYRLVRGAHNLWASKKMIREMRKILGI